MSEGQKNGIKHALNQMVTLISSQKYNETYVSTIESLINYLHETRFDQDSRILVCSNDDNTSDFVADRIYEMNKLTVVSFCIEHNKNGNIKPFHLDHLYRKEPPADIPEMNKNVLTTLELVKLHDEELNA